MEARYFVLSEEGKHDKDPLTLENIINFWHVQQIPQGFLGIAELSGFKVEYDIRKGEVSLHSVSQHPAITILLNKETVDSLIQPVQQAIATYAQFHFLKKIAGAALQPNSPLRSLQSLLANQAFSAQANTKIKPHQVSQAIHAVASYLRNSSIDRSQLLAINVYAINSLNKAEAILQTLTNLLSPQEPVKANENMPNPTRRK